MAERAIPRPVIPPGSEKVKFHYEKSTAFRVVHVDGAIGGLTPSFDLFISMYSQRAPIPKVTVQKITPSGQLGEEIMDEREQREGIFREVEVGLVMNLPTAKVLHQWLTEKIELADKAQQQIDAAAQKKGEQKLQ